MIKDFIGHYHDELGDHLQIARLILLLNQNDSTQENRVVTKK